MACFKPLRAVRLDDGSISFKAPRGAGSDLQLPCGQCVGCRIDRSKAWAARCVHEAQMHEHNCFVTLTYDDEHLPSDGSLVYRDFQLFMKRLRQAAKRSEHTIHCLTQVSDDEKVKKDIRFYMCGEYGEATHRPHYHALLFNCDFGDRYQWASRLGNKLFRSPTLEKLWPFGNSMIGEVTFESAAYVARYVMKKIQGDSDKTYFNSDLYDERYKRVDEFGEIRYLKPEFNKMSLKPGIGATWLDEYLMDVYPEGKLVLPGGRKQRPPRYYDLKYEKKYPFEFDQLKQDRIMSAIARASDNTPERLEVKAEVLSAAVNQLKRTL